jgi:Photosynthesis system II assembly factor YCF48
MTPQERDASMDRLLRDAMAADVRSAPGECLDADTLAAWSEGTLSAAECAVAETHASRCVRCQAMLAAMVRTAPPVEAPSRSPFFRWVITLGPALAAAAAVVLWFAVDRQSSPPVLPERSAVVATAPESKSADAKNAPAAGHAAPAELDAFRADKDKADKKDVNKEVADEARVAERQPSSRVDAVAGELRDRNERVGAAGAVAEAVKVAPKPADREREFAAGALPAPAPATLPTVPPPPPAAPVAATRSTQETVISPVPTLDQIQTQQRQNAAAPSQQAAQTQSQTVSGYTQNEEKARGQTGDRRALLARDVNTLLVPSPIPAVRWRVTDGRTVQFSMDGGKVWATQYTLDAPTQILAGVSPSSSVCWLVGQGGFILVTKDGRTWQRITFPETVDLRAVTATDATVASVVTVDGRTFTTSDAGTTWTQK